ncbi:MAG TPA: helix-turn-helix domain-containing protein [Solirubrobacteraceae bacterium]|nr:helix-turn-helix domain-containing protein [Solirubrobacteraceae bacterium]
MTDLLETAKPMRADARRNRELILAAARELLGSEKAEAQIDEVAARAGVGVGTVYRHFPDKEALLGELVRERFIRFNARLQEAIEDESAAPFDALAGALRRNAAESASDAATRRALMSGSERVFAHAEAEKEEFLRLAEVLVGRAHRAGELREDFVASDVPMVMCGVCSTMGKRDAGWEWERHLELVLRGMRPSG